MNVGAETSLPVSNNSYAPMLQVGFGLLAIIGIILGFAWLARRLGYVDLYAQKNMRVIAALPLGNREKAVLIQVGEQQILIGVAPGRVSALQTFEHAVVDTRAVTKNKSNFAKSMDQNAQNTGAANAGDFSRYLKGILTIGSTR